MLPSPRALLVALAVVAGLVALPAQSRAAHVQISLMQDDNLLVYRTDAARDAALNQMKALGVDGARVTVLWSVVAQGARSTKARRRRFRADNPRTYPHRNWDRYDGLVRALRARGMLAYLDVTGPGPSWAHRKTRDRRNRATFKPKVTEFAKFVKAVGRRYSGRYRDENQGRTVLPKVSIWSLYNEPNQGGWLTPQYERSRILHRVIPESPILYRSLYLYGRRALQQTGHGKDVILAGETAPLGTSRQTSRSAIRPKKFIRELFCVSPSGRPYTGRSARARGCSIFRRFGGFAFSGWAHHPYTKDLPPTRTDSSRDSITMANIGDLPTLLDQIAGATGYFPPGEPVWSTEFGYETKPPDPFRKTSLAQQAEFNNVGDWEAYNNPRVLAQTQFLLRDVPPNKRFKRGSKPYWFTYQSGLYFAKGTPKPAATAWALPVVVRDQGDGTVDVWGQLRFEPNGFQAGRAQVQFRPQGESDFQNVGGPIQVTDALGYFDVQVPSPGPGTWRVTSTAISGFDLFSRSVPVQ